MHDLELLQRLAAALAIGLLIGVERGWTMRDEPEGERSVGLRTLALTGLLGGVCGALALKLDGGGMVLGLAFLAYALVIAFLRYREIEHEKTFGATTIVAAYVAFALGALAVVGDPGAAAAAGVAATGLLALKAALHGWLKRLTWNELRAGLVLLAMTLILLPVLPNRGFGPLGAINPYELWLMTVLIACVSSAGYIAMKWVGGHQGVALSGIAGGLVSSTAVTLSFSRLAKESPSRCAGLAAGILLAGTTMMLRILFVAGSINLALLPRLALPLLLAGLASAGLAFWSFAKSRDADSAAPLDLKNPFELGTVLKFGAFLSVIMVAATWLTAVAGDWGAYGLAAVSGIADVDAITLSMARLGQGSLAIETAATAILLAATVNTLAKAALAWIAGGKGPGLRIALGAALSIAAGLIGYALTAVWDPFAAIATHLAVS